jgi:hypothetical protein
MISIGNAPPAMPPPAPRCGDGPEGLYRNVDVNGEKKTILFGSECGNDDITVTMHDDGSSTIVMNGKQYELTAEETRTLEIHTQGGDDRIHFVDERSFRDQPYPPVMNNGGTDTADVVFPANRSEGRAEIPAWEIPPA